jgi:hypothetical protein
MVTNSTSFPTDAQHYIPAIPMKWLLSCGIDYSAQRQYNIQWSPSLEVVCWKIDDQCWQGRTFAEKALTKYISYGKIHEKPHILWNKATYPNTLVLVEDYISAIRVSQTVSCMPLFGCTINTELLLQIQQEFV